jgi:WD40 repeat protein
MTPGDGSRDEPSSLASTCNGASKPHSCDDLIDDDEPVSSSDIEECLRRLDEVWPPEEPSEPDGLKRLGRFTIVRELGRGGFGVVFLADDPLMGRRVALKVPRVEVLSGTEGWRRFVRESRASSRLDHPNLVPVLEAGSIGPMGYIISTYVAGPSLEQWLRHHRRIAPPRWAAQLVATLAHGIEHAHQRQVLHRDLKPANILLQAPDGRREMPDHDAWRHVPLESWVPRICDFGLARLRELEGDESQSRAGAAGSPPYMAPEQAEARRSEIGPATDVYGLGAILYQILTGRPPFVGKSDLDTLRRVVVEEPTALRQLRHGVPRDLETICLKCLAKRPDQRYASAAGLAQDLERFLDGRPIRARSVPAWERAWRWGRRRPAEATLVATVMVAALAGLGGLVWHDTRLGQVNEQLRLAAGQAQANAREAQNQKARVEAQVQLNRLQQAGHQVYIAQQAVTVGNFDVARRLLGDAGPSMGQKVDRGFAWSFVTRSISDRIVILEGHEATVWALSASPDGHTVASADQNREVRLWDVRSGECRRLPVMGQHSVQHLAFSPDGRSLLSSTIIKGECFLWDVPTARLRGKLARTGAEVVSAFFFSRDGRRVAAVRPGLFATRPFTCWDVTPAVGEMPFLGSSDAKAIADELTDERLQDLADCLDDAKPNRLESLVKWKQSWTELPPRGVAITRDKRLAVVGFGDGSVAVCRLESSEHLMVGSVSSKGMVLVVLDVIGIEGKPRPAELTKIRQLVKVLVHTAAERSPTDIIIHRGILEPAAFSADGRRLALWDEGAARLQVLELPTGREEFSFGLGRLRGLRAMAFTHDGKAMVFGGIDGKVRIWHLNAPGNPEILDGHAPKEAWSVAFSPDGRTLASAGDDHCIRLWDVATGRETGVLRGHDSMVSSIAFSPDGRTLASGSFDPKTAVILWDLATARPRFTLRGHTKYVRGVAFHPDGRRVASVDDDGKLMLWDTSTGERTAVIAQHTSRASRVAFSPDGRTVASGSGRFDGRIMLYDPAAGTSRSIEAGAEIHALAYSPDGSHLTAGLFGGLIKTWEIASGREVSALSGHSLSVEGVAVSPDGRSLASAGEDGTVRVWDPQTGQELLCLTDCKARVNSVAFSPDGSILAAADHTGAVTLWRARPGP